MKRCPWIRLCIPLVVLAAASGCLITHHATKVVRENETRRSVQFESDDAQQAFDAGALAAKSRKDARKGSVLAIPFLLWYSREEVLSDNASYNEQLAACDSDGDGFITCHEATAFCSRSRGEAAVVNASPLVELEGPSPRTAAAPMAPDSAPLR